jgi:phage shock protein PspC (stress-responsive transcriptional regulator)
MQDALPANEFAQSPVTNEVEPPLPLRSDTILGVCEALGQDFGFHPNYLRVILSAMVLVSWTAAFGIYLGLGVAVALSRWLYPAPPIAAAPRVAAPSEAPAADNQAEAELLAA